MSGGEWIGPTVEETILGLKAKGHGGVFLQPIGFLCDHIEVLYDIDIAFRQFAEKEGMRLWRAESLNGSPLLTEALSRSGPQPPDTSRHDRLGVETQLAASPVSRSIGSPRMETQQAASLRRTKSLTPEPERKA